MYVSIQEIKPKEIINPLEDMQELERPVVMLDLKTTVLTATHCLIALSPILDHSKFGGQWYEMENIATQKVTHRRTDYSDIRKDRLDKLIVVGNGRNVVTLHDWTEKEKHTQIHDPEVKIVGPDARAIYDVFFSGIVSTLRSKIFGIKVEIDTEALDEYLTLNDKEGKQGRSRKYKDILKKETKEVVSEAEQVLKLKLDDIIEDGSTD